ncbi:MAG: hypothetical protein OM95_03220 [Bdellovibrio sp. ArHS]|uniref:hypothetical protein n=1 Tax=Bdellovibrio sp. ArHS TaxID=1569284 RepID=UPI0005834E0A|nr:hypothetical protein [Bdellovibrio sp. ArHS]KHD89396.1 MAG: hypothetical protein OM95_03220 [Bdellovibrio sp. ArHS]
MIRLVYSVFTIMGLLFCTAGCGVTAQISQLTSKTEPSSPVYEDLTDVPPITVNNPLDLSTITAPGTAPFTYEIVEGGGSISGTTYTPGATAGDVIIKITDGSGQVSHIKIPVAKAPTISPAQIYLGTSDTFDFSGVDGVPPYTYSATGGTITSTGLFTADSSTGPATVTVTDSLGNTFTLNLTIRSPLSSSISAATIGPLNTVTMTGVDGAGGYGYSLVSGPGSINAVTGVYSPGGSSGTAVLRVTDAAGKTSDQTVTVTTLLTISPASKTLVINGTTTFVAAGGLPPYSYSMGVGNAGTVGLTTGAYQAPAVAASESVIVTDSLGNTATANVTVKLTLKISASKTKFYINTPITFTGVDGIPPYTYSLVMGAGTLDSTTGAFSTTSIGIKRIRVTDSSGASALSMVTAYNPLTASSFNVAINSDITFIPSGGIPPYTATVVSGGGSVSALNYTAPNALGTAILNVTDAEGNSVNVTANITPLPAITQFNVSGPYVSTTVNVTAAGTDYDKWCLLEGINYVSACVWQNGTLPSTFDTGHLLREGRSYFAFVSRGSAFTSATSNKFFDSVFPLSSKNNFGEATSVAATNDGFWVTDSALNKVHKYDSNGNWLMALGTHTASSSAGYFRYPIAAAVDAAGNLYVADQGNHRVQVFSSSGQWLRQIPSDGVINSATDGHFQNPWFVYIDSAGNTYISDNAQRVQKFDATGTWLFSFGSAGNGNGQFTTPKNITLDSAGNIYVLDYGNSRIQKFNPTGSWLATYGGPGTTNGLFDGLAGLHVDASGTIYVMDRSRLQQFNSAGVFQSSSTLSSGTFSVEYAGGMSIAPDGSIYAVESARSLVSKFNASLNFQFSLGSTATDNGSFYYPRNIHRDSSGNLWVVDNGSCRVQKFSSAGTWLLSFGSCGSANGQLLQPTAVVVASDGSIYVADSLNLRVQKFDPSGSYVSQFPIGQIADMIISPSDILYATRSSTVDAIKFDTSGNILDTYGAGTLETVSGIAIDTSGNIYVAEEVKSIIHKFSSANVYLGTIGSKGLDDGQFFNLMDVTIAPNGDIIALDNQPRVQVLDSTGAFKSKFGNYGYQVGQFIYPRNITVDPTNGDLYIVDSHRQRIQKFNSAGLPQIQ